MIDKKTVFSVLLFSFVSSLQAMQLDVLSSVEEIGFPADELSIEKDCSVADSVNEYNDAIERGDSEKVRSLLAQAAAVKAAGARDGLDRGALLDYADLHGNLEVSHCILEAMEPNEIVDYLIGKYGEASSYYEGPSQSLRGTTVMHSAVLMLLMFEKSEQFESKKRLIPLLVAAGAPINEEHLMTKMTPYEYMVALGNESLQAVLLSNGARPRTNRLMVEADSVLTELAAVEEVLIEAECEVHN